MFHKSVLRDCIRVCWLVLFFSVYWVSPFIPGIPTLYCLLLAGWDKVAVPTTGRQLHDFNGWVRSNPSVPLEVHIFMPSAFVCSSAEEPLSLADVLFNQ